MQNLECAQRSELLSRYSPDYGDEFFSGYTFLGLSMSALERSKRFPDALNSRRYVVKENPGAFV